MRLNADHLDHARKVADAILYEGYLLYPYHKSAQKNQIRFQFGVLMPPGYARVDPNEASSCQTECLLECPDDAEVDVLVRFLHLQRRLVQRVSPETADLHDVATLSVNDAEYTTWDEAVEREQRLTTVVSSLVAGDEDVAFHIDAGEAAEDLTDASGRLAGRLVRRWACLDGMIRLHAERVAGPYQALRLRVQVENSTAPRAELRSRDDGLGSALIAAHLLAGVPGGTFLSMTDPPRASKMQQSLIRYLRSAPAGAAARSGQTTADDGIDWRVPAVTARPAVPWWDPGSDASVSPETDHVLIDGIRVSRNSRVRMQPGSRRADAQDLFLAGREATVEAVLFDVDGQVHLAVTPVDDPAADLQRYHGRFLYFAPDEVQPLPQSASVTEPAEGGMQ